MSLRAVLKGALSGIDVGGSRAAICMWRFNIGNSSLLKLARNHMRAIGIIASLYKTRRHKEEAAEPA
jgi:glutamate dehydrogenase/leucine dehydrogenase